MKVQKRLKSLFYVKKFEKFVSSRQPTNNTFTEVNFVPLVFQYTCGPKKSNKPRYQENQSPGLFPFPTYKKIFIQKGKHHYPTTTPHPISLPKKPSLFPVFPRHRTASLLTKLQKSIYVLSL